MEAMRAVRLPHFAPCGLAVRHFSIPSRDLVQRSSPFHIASGCLKRHLATCQASKKGTDAIKEADQTNLLASVGTGILWCAFVGYATVFAPNQFPSQDTYFIEKIVGLHADDGYQVNRVFNDLFFLIGIVAAVYAPLLIPSARSKNKVPAWPFVGASFALGGFALLPYFALWQPDPEVTAPPGEEELEGLTRLSFKFQETLAYGVLLTLFATYYMGDAVLSGGAAWKEFAELFSTSQLVHVTSLDFLILNLLCPFWLANDAEKRSWDQRDGLGKVLPFIPVVGPAIYITLRPRAQ